MFQWFKAICSVLLWSGLGLLTLSLIVILSLLFTFMPIDEEENTPTVDEQETFTPVPKLDVSKVIKDGKYSTIVLNRGNTLVLRDVIDEDNVSGIIKQAIDMSHRLKPTDEIYLVIYSPGGYIDSGLLLIDALKGLPQKVNTITIFGASMAFHTVQNLNKRYIIPSGELMSHHAKGGVEGQIPGEAVTRLQHALQMITDMEQKVADRMSITLEEYRIKHDKEYWVTGKWAVEDKAADQVVYIRCDESMMGTYVKKVNVLVFEINVTFNVCPLITTPVKIEVVDMTSEQQIMLNTLLYNPREYNRKYLDKE